MWKICLCHTTNEELDKNNQICLKNGDPGRKCIINLMKQVMPLDKVRTDCSLSQTSFKAIGAYFARM
jgi:hypothetical protein